MTNLSPTNHENAPVKVMATKPVWSIVRGLRQDLGPAFAEAATRRQANNVTE